MGTNAVNGVINIITKKAKDTHGTLASAGGGSIEQGFANLRHGGGNGKSLDYRIYGKGFNRGPEYHADDQNYDDWRGGQAGFRVDWAKNERDNFTVQGDIYDQADGESVQATSYTPPYSQIFGWRRSSIWRKYHGPLDENTGRGKGHSDPGLL